ncbi:hypothetical protein NE865_07620 [Phthorimaea operculella]|nr:hypothetical protein NE865_07620 [Phthorimaea operculella]
MTKKVSECQAETVQFMAIEKVQPDPADEFSGSTLLRRGGKKLEDNNNLTKEDLEYLNYRQLLKYEQAPHYLQHNPYIRDGYRKLLPTKLCWESIFWWTNETMNIWTHIFGFFLLLSLTINDLAIINIHATVTDRTVAGILFSCFLICMALSALYHTFSCRSETDYNTFLMYDLFGIALSLLAIYTSGVYYAFWCHQELRMFYMTSVTLIFIVAMLLQVPRFNVPYLVKMCVFIGWAAYGVLPTLHWTYTMGGFDNPMMCVFIGWAAYGVLPTLHWTYTMGGFDNPMVQVRVCVYVCLNVPYLVKMCVFIGWAAYGVLPTLHWTYTMRGFDNPMMFFPRVIGMYVISGTAFAIYAFKIPERWFPGKVDYIGHSHQWWHVLVLGALYYWHNSAMIYVQYRMNHGCANNMRIF